MTFTSRKQFRSSPSQSPNDGSTLTRQAWRALRAFAALGAVATIVGLSAQPAYADGFVTMHGATCKPNAPANSSVTFGNELWTNGSPATIICPLVTQWGNDGRPPTSITNVKMYFGSHGTVVCTLYRHSGLFGNQNTGFPGTLSGSDWNKVMSFPNPPALGGLENNNYFIQCSLPAGTALYNVAYRSFAY